MICRPQGGDDVPFRSVASRLVKGLSAEARAVFQLDVLRPPTIEQLGRALREAKAAGKPYHVVHFDGHGVYGDAEAVRRSLNPDQFRDSRPGQHGYLVFEQPALSDNRDPLGGPDLGRLLVETGVPVLVLNACRSAHAEGDPRPETRDPRPVAQGDEATGRRGDGAPNGAEANSELRTQNSELNTQSSELSPHEHVRAFGSLAQEVMDAGVAGVVAMRYNVYVVTAAQFVADLYAALVRGQTLGEAATLGRKQLHTQPLRELAGEPRELHDWPVPIVYEAAPIALFPRQAIGDWRLEIGLGSLQSPASSLPAVPPPPDVGFFGRDETLLALDRAFDTQPIALLHAYAGAGKTSVAAEFARWYAQTGGLGPQPAVLWTSFEQRKPLARVLDDVGRVFGKALEHANVHWDALSEQERRDITLQVVLKQIPVLWMGCSRDSCVNRT